MSISSSQSGLNGSPLAVSSFFNSLQPLKHIVFNEKVVWSSPNAFPSESATSAGHQIWYRVSQLASKHKQFSENAIRAQIFAAKPRLGAKTRDGNSWIKGNGLALAIRRCGRSVLINEPMYSKWIATGSCGEGSEV